MAAPDTSSAIYIEGLRKSFGRQTVLHDLSLRVAHGESLVIIGGSGSGKSVLLKSMLGLIQPDAGRIMVNGEDVSAPGTRRHATLMQHIGMLFQSGALFDSLRVWENITFAARQERRISRDDAITLAEQKLQSVGLNADVAQKMPSELSGGMQKRVALARAICNDPSIIFFDEPTTGLDPIMADVINGLIVSCCKEIGATAVTITHDMTSAQKIGDRIAMLYEGSIIWDGDAAHAMTSGHEIVDQFVHGRATGPITDSRAA